MEVTPLDPISADAPCGPDLDLEGDPDFLNFMAATEGQLPASFFSFDRKSIDFPAAFAAAEPLLKRTHDVRLYALLAKLAILNRDLAGFGTWMVTIASLLEQRWDEVHPRGENGDFGARLAQLGTLNDGPVVVLPLQYAPLIESQRDGAFVFRAELVGSGDVKPREGETLPPAAAVTRILEQCDFDLLRARAALVGQIGQAAASIERTTQERVGYEQGVKLNDLRSLIERIQAYLQAAIARRDPNAATTHAAADSPDPEGETRASGSAKPGRFTSLAEVDAALAAAHGYFLASEPSSPALMLVGQARESLGKTLYDVLKLLAPAHAEAARVFVGRDSPFPVPVSALANTVGPEIARASVDPSASRAEALQVIDAVAAHLRSAEPSSPAPLLLERAKALASRDFLALLGELMPEESLNAMKTGR